MRLPLLKNSDWNIPLFRIHINIEERQVGNKTFIIYPFNYLYIDTYSAI